MGEPVFTRDGALNPRRPLHIVCVGRKGSGKSVLSRVLFDSYPRDRLVLDVTGDVGREPEWVEVQEPIPARWPESERPDPDRPMVLRYVPDARSKTYLEDMDAYAGLAYAHGHCMLWVDEMDQLAPVHRTPPHTRRILRQGRHRRLSSIWCGPRPINVDPLVLGQADLVYVFELPNPNDRRRIADTIGHDPDDFDTGVAALGPHEYLRYVAGEEDPQRRLLHFPPLPKDVLGPAREVPERVGDRQPGDRR